MGLDQYAYAYTPNGGEEKLQQWRKHANLQGFMEEIWEDRGRPVFDRETGEETSFNEEKHGGCFGDFNCVPLLLRVEDIDALEACVKRGELPHTTGFFFGESLPEDRELDEEFIKAARLAMSKGCSVIYDSWW